MKKEDYHHLTSKYSFLSDYENRYRKELISFINEAFEKHDNVFELKCTTHDSWKEADEDNEFDAMNDLPVYLMVDNQCDGLDEVYITRAERTGEYGNAIYIDGYDYSIGEFVEDYYTNSYIDDLQSIAAFINAVLIQEQESQEDE